MSCHAICSRILQQCISKAKLIPCLSVCLILPLLCSFTCLSFPQFAVSINELVFMEFIKWLNKMFPPHPEPVRSSGCLSTLEPDQYYFSHYLTFIDNMGIFNYAATVSCILTTINLSSLFRFVKYFQRNQKDVNFFLWLID